MLYGLRTAVAVFAAAVATCSNATPISYQFTVAATDGPLAGISSTGSFFLRRQQHHAGRIQRRGWTSSRTRLYVERYSLQPVHCEYWAVVVPR
jgi:hypothetical protein